jgi:hypothetical protein
MMRTISKWTLKGITKRGHGINLPLKTFFLNFFKITSNKTKIMLKLSVYLKYNNCLFSIFLYSVSHKSYYSQLLYLLEYNRTIERPIHNLYQHSSLSNIQVEQSRTNSCKYDQSFDDHNHLKYLLFLD